MNTLLNVKRFTLVLFLATLAVMVLSMLIQRFIGVVQGSSALSFVPIMAAAMYEGQRIAMDGEVSLSKSQAWACARVGAIVSVIFGVVMALVLTFALSALTGSTTLFPPVPPWVWLVVLAIVAILSLLLCRYFLMMGFKQQRKLLDKKDANS